MFEFKVITSVIDDGFREDYSKFPLLAVKLTPYIDATHTNVLYGNIDTDGTFTIAPYEDSKYAIGIGEYGKVYFHVVQDLLPADTDMRVIRTMAVNGYLSFSLSKKHEHIVMLWTDNGGWEDFCNV